ncbi:hypothetical protein IFM58399_00079 [Aspergillus lentulus]|uniref:Thioesterase/thiol ester dehydrase-isomerase n=1 Tax=Aspergillus lentulus TaxID=293939 RepID=A0ABQ0ZQP2_ASPLE|nr:uncharacterized protein IFM58399_00079 [Aspergillus lentulus]GFF22871.1 hypothetical protein IFM58399_00079 [Aspergillus lentulus]GFF60944.1 hypothetical protein IFM60648_00079 [Aspergillus lentulus]GFF62464.1 hypothetical protein IFM47457_00081 [Aspergillus lentulus]GFF63979.1 hypothetical protein IFM62136_05809 [Aspergillus lentulus]
MIAIHTLKRQRLTAITSQASSCYPRFFSISPISRDARSSASKQPPSKPHSIDPRWLTMIKRRIGKCMMFGLKPPQVKEAGDILQRIARDWRELVAGSEGYLTDEQRRGHVNNVTYLRYAETARVYFIRNIAVHIDPAHRKEWMNLVSPKGVGVIVRSLKIDYKFPMTYPDKVTVYHKLVHDPSAQQSQFAFDLQAMILSEARQRPAARVHEDIVVYDYKQNKKTILPPFVEAQFQTMWDLQERARKHWQQQILDIETQVRKLEVESWDREDAVEDMGSARK